MYKKVAEIYQKERPINQIGNSLGKNITRNWVIICPHEKGAENIFH